MPEGLESPSITPAVSAIETSFSASVGQPEIGVNQGKDFGTKKAPELKDLSIGSPGITLESDIEVFDDKSLIDASIAYRQVDNIFDIFGGPIQEDQLHIILDPSTREKTTVLQNEKPQLFYKEMINAPSPEMGLKMIRDASARASERILSNPDIVGKQALMAQRDEYKLEWQKYWDSNPNEIFLTKTENGGESFFRVDENGNRIEADQVSDDLGEGPKIDAISEELRHLGDDFEAGGQNFSTIDQEITQIVREITQAVKNEIKKDQQRKEVEEEQRRLKELLARVKELIIKTIVAQTENVTQSVVNKANDGELFNNSNIVPEERQQRLDNWGSKVKEYFNKKADKLKAGYRASTWDGVAVLGDLAARIGGWDTKMFKEIGGPFNNLAGFTSNLAEQSRVRAQNARQISSSIRTGAQNG